MDVRTKLGSFIVLIVFAVPLTTLSQVASADGPFAGGSATEVDTRAVRLESGLGPTPIFSFIGPGIDFDTSGAATRIATIPGVPPAAEPFFTLTGPVMPDGASEVKTSISWNWLLDGVPPAESTIMVDDLDGGGFVPVVGDLVGSGTPDLCWVKEGGASYLADVTGLGVVAFGGSNNISGATDQPQGTDENAFGEGLTILLVYEIPNTLARNIDVYAGYSSTESDLGNVGTAAISLTFSVEYLGGDMPFFVNALDGQLDPGFGEVSFLDQFFINGQSATELAGGIHDDAWQGLLFAAPPTPGPPPMTDWLYDHADGDISLVITAPADGLLAETVRPLSGDCMGHTLAAVSFPAPYIPAASDWGLAVMTLLMLAAATAVLLRRRQRNTSAEVVGPASSCPGT